PQAVPLAVQSLSLVHVAWASTRSLHASGVIAPRTSTSFIALRVMTLLLSSRVGGGVQASRSLEVPGATPDAGVGDRDRCPVPLNRQCAIPAGPRLRSWFRSSPRRPRVRDRTAQQAPAIRAPPRRAAAAARAAAVVPAARMTAARARAAARA